MDQREFHQRCGTVHDSRVTCPDDVPFSARPVLAEMAKRKDRPGDQPLPVPNDGPSMHDLVCEDLAKFGNEVAALELAADLRDRKALGLDRYGTVLQIWNGRDALGDAADEACDLLVYLRQALEEAAARRDETLRSQLAPVYHQTMHAAMELAWIRAIRRVHREH